MKRVIKSGTNTVTIPERLDVIEAETDEAAEAFDDKIKAAETDFDYIISGLDQLDIVQANDILSNLHESLQKFISDIANQLS